MGADIVFSVGEKMFAVTGSATPAEGMCFKVEDDRFLELTDRPGIIPAPYLARAKWDQEAAALLRRSYELLAKLSKKLQREIAAGVA